MTQRSRVLEALGTVYDPELDEPITDLGFVASVVVAGGAVAVRLRLPTPQCAPNFAFLMAADASRAIWRVDGVESVDVTLEDHYTGDGVPVAADDRRFPRMASLTALSLETNGGMCRDLLRVRYGGEVAA